MYIHIHTYLLVCLYHNVMYVICMYVCICMYIYIYIYILRQRRGKARVPLVRPTRKQLEGESKMLDTMQKPNEAVETKRSRHSPKCHEAKA